MEDMVGVFIPIVAMLIPITAILAGLGIALAALKHRAKTAELEHQERMLAIEKGVPLPPAAIPQTRQRNPYLAGFILIGIGLAMMIGMGIAGDEDWAWGAIFLLPGLAIILAHKLYTREREKKGLNGPAPLTQESKLT